MKDNTEVIGITDYTVKVEGERHSLLIKSAKISDGGKYCVTAINQVGRASSNANLIVKAGKLFIIQMDWTLFFNYNLFGVVQITHSKL